MSSDSTGSGFGSFTAGHAIDMLMRVFEGSAEPTPAEVEQKVDELLSSALLSHLRDDRRVIIDEVLARTKVIIGSATALDDDSDHIEWLDGTDRTAWRFWPRLDDYLRTVDRLPPAVLHEINASTDLTLRRLESPDRPGTWDRRGLVVGHVQSGKTTHYTALAAKALDAGYQIVIILAGIHNSLRSQTHERIDRHLIGRDSTALINAVREHGRMERTEGLTGVGEVDWRLGRPDLPFTLLTCTTSADDGDFKTNVAKQIGFQVGPGSRLVLVVKKHATILRKLIDWLQVQHAGRVAEGRPIPNPALVIDDEADHASINTARDPEADPTKINALIRELLMSFRRVGFVGYTATPFANIFAYHKQMAGALGPDLFPRSFILNLKAPSDYIGPSLVFGHPGDESAGLPAQSALPMHVPVADADFWLPDKHKRTWIPGALPPTAREAIRLFVLICAARAVRGQVDVHNSMLVHGTRFIDVQERVHAQVRDELDAIRNVLGLGHRSDITALRDQSESNWQERLAKPHPVFASRLGERAMPLPDWEAVWNAVPESLARITLMRINGNSSDALAYSRAERGLSVIAIGGDKLSRGLTLEGLTVSYFLRSSQMFDTLMQMGRWFGYRRGYADLCRVYTTPSLHSAFRDIALAMDELRGDLDYMAAVGKTPEAFGLRVREPSDGLVITAANKIRSGENVTVRFAGTLVQTLELARTGDTAKTNLDATTTLIGRLGRPERHVRKRPTQHALWHGIKHDTILAFLTDYEAFSTPSFYNHCEALRRYINEQVSRGELVDWTVAVVGKATSDTWSVGGEVFRKVTRANTGAPERFVTQAVVGSADEALDLDKDEWAEAMRLSSGRTQAGDLRTNPERERVRAVRPPQRGLLLIYPAIDLPESNPIPLIALSFPTSDTAKALSYRVNKTWVEQRGLFDRNDDDDAD
jgi:hypothetical protein